MLAHSLSTEFHMVWSIRQLEYYSAATIGKQRELSLLFLLLSLGLKMGWYGSQSGWIFPPLLNIYVNTITDPPRGVS